MTSLPHGNSRYCHVRYRCRCEVCREAHRLAAQRYRNGLGWRDAAHQNRLLRGRGPEHIGPIVRRVMDEIGRAG